MKSNLYKIQFFICLMTILIIIEVDSLCSKNSYNEYQCLFSSNYCLSQFVISAKGFFEEASWTMKFYGILGLWVIFSTKSHLEYHYRLTSPKASCHHTLETFFFSFDILFNIIFKSTITFEKKKTYFDWSSFWSNRISMFRLWTSEMLFENNFGKGWNDLLKFVRFEIFSD